MAISPVLDRTLHSHYKACALCPRCCRVDRTAGQIGFCGEGADVKIAAIGAHLGEEPLITGQKGSGTVFFSGCSLRCIFCQNHQISRGGMGKKWNLEKTVDRLVQLYEMTGVHNVNFVTQTIFFRTRSLW